MSTLQSFIFFAQEAAHDAGHEESDKTLFYVLGGVAAAYGVTVASLGIVRPDFPGSKGAARGVFALSALVVLAAMASSVLTG